MDNTMSKRKRGPATPVKPLASAAFHRNPEHSMLEPEITPNPKPRKQRHTYTLSLGSPTRESLGSPPCRGTSTDRVSTNKVIEGQVKTTPTKMKKKVVVKSPHATNPEADYILPTFLTAENRELMKKNVAVRRAILGAKGSRRSATPIPPYEPPSDVFTPPREVFLSPGPSKNISRSSKRKSTTNSTKRKGLRLNTTNLPVQVKQEIPDDIDLLAPMPPPSPTDDPLLLSGPLEPEPKLETFGDGESQPSSQAQAEVDMSYNKEDQPVEADSMEMGDSYDVDVMPVNLFDWNVGTADGGGWTDSDDDEEEGEGEYTGKWKMMKVRTKQDPPSSATRTRQERWGRPISPFPKIKSLNLVSEEEEEEEEVRRLSVEPELHNSENEDEERQVREMSMEFEKEAESPNPETQGAASDETCSIQEAIFIGEEDETSDSDDEPVQVKITSTDPRAAARAAAILKQVINIL